LRAREYKEDDSIDSTPLQWSSFLPEPQNSIIITIGNKEVEEGEKRKNGDFLGDPV
jgi:hypothetical protein